MYGCKTKTTVITKIYKKYEKKHYIIKGSKVVNYVSEHLNLKCYVANSEIFSGFKYQSIFASANVFHRSSSSSIAMSTQGVCFVHLKKQKTCQQVSDLETKPTV